MTNRTLDAFENACDALASWASRHPQSFAFAYSLAIGAVVGMILKGTIL